jgi:acetyltransferase-like isoleucine patch superfamily enzyme
MKPIISPNTRIRHPELFEIGIYSIIDDFCYFSTKVKIGISTHIAACCTVAGGKESQFTCGDFGGLSSGVRVFCSSDDFINDIAGILPTGFSHLKDHLIVGNVVLGNYVTVGANSVVMPNVIIPEGTCIGAMSFVRSNVELEPWSVYAGFPKLRKIGMRNKDNVLRQVETIKKSLNI